MEQLKQRIIKLEEENEKLKTQLIDLLFEQNYNKQTELIEFLRELYKDVNSKEISKLSSKIIIKNLKEYIEEFAKNNNILLK